jgi:hypothetical protein
MNTQIEEQYEVFLVPFMDTTNSLFNQYVNIDKEILRDFVNNCKTFEQDSIKLFSSQLEYKQYDIFLALCNLGILLNFKENQYINLSTLVINDEQNNKLSFSYSQATFCNTEYITSVLTQKDIISLTSDHKRVILAYHIVSHINHNLQSFDFKTIFESKEEQDRFKSLKQIINSEDNDFHYFMLHHCLCIFEKYGNNTSRWYSIRKANTNLKYYLSLCESFGDIILNYTPKSISVPDVFHFMYKHPNSQKTSEFELVITPKMILKGDENNKVLRLSTSLDKHFQIVCAFVCELPGFTEEYTVNIVLNNTTGYLNGVSDEFISKVEEQRKKEYTTRAFSWSEMYGYDRETGGVVNLAKFIEIPNLNLEDTKNAIFLAEHESALNEQEENPTKTLANNPMSLEDVLPTMLTDAMSEPVRVEYTDEDVEVPNDDGKKSSGLDKFNTIMTSGVSYEDLNTKSYIDAANQFIVSGAFSTVHRYLEKVYVSPIGKLSFGVFSDIYALGLISDFNRLDSSFNLNSYLEEYFNAGTLSKEFILSLSDAEYELILKEQMVGSLIGSIHLARNKKISTSSVQIDHEFVTSFRNIFETLLNKPDSWTILLNRLLQTGEPSNCPPSWHKSELVRLFNEISNNLLKDFIKYAICLKATNAQYSLKKAVEFTYTTDKTTNYKVYFNELYIDGIWDKSGRPVLTTSFEDSVYYLNINVYGKDNYKKMLSFDIDKIILI